ncbi:MAG: hypothetical protein ACO3JL_20815, partial [Myxococcota bacterium]
MTTGPDGSVYLSDNDQVFRLSPSGDALQVLLPSGSVGGSPTALAVNTPGTKLFVADPGAGTGNRRILEIDLQTNAMSVVVPGIGELRGLVVDRLGHLWFTGDDGTNGWGVYRFRPEVPATQSAPALLAELARARDLPDATSLTLDRNQNLYVLVTPSTGNAAVGRLELALKVVAAGEPGKYLSRYLQYAVSTATIIGGGSPPANGAEALGATLDNPVALSVSGDRLLVVENGTNKRVRRIELSGAKRILPMSGILGATTRSTPTAFLRSIDGIFYLADGATLRRFDPTEDTSSVYVAQRIPATASAPERWEYRRESTIADTQDEVDKPPCFTGPLSCAQPVVSATHWAFATGKANAFEVVWGYTAVARKSNVRALPVHISELLLDDMAGPRVVLRANETSYPGFTDIYLFDVSRIEPLSLVNDDLGPART